MATPTRVFVPFGSMEPDNAMLGGEQLALAVNVAPKGDKSYVPSQIWTVRKSSNLSGQPRGYYIHPTTGVTANWLGYYGPATKLYELDSSANSNNWTETDRSRLVGGNYAATSDPGWNGTSFGDNVIMTNFYDDPQILTTPGAGNFAKLAQSGGANPGMDPKAKYAFPVRGNLFLANLTLGAAFDGLPIGANPTVVAWSQSDNARQYGSSNVTPQLIGAGYQPLNFDIGSITGAIGGQYGLTFHQRGIVRIDGPPYSFRVISSEVGTAFHKSIVRFGDDVYFWGPLGPAVLRGGESPVIHLASGRVSRTLLDLGYGLPDNGGIINQYGIIATNYTSTLVSAAICALTRQIWWAYQVVSLSDFPVAPTICLVKYDVDNDRFSLEQPAGATGSPGLPLFYLQSIPTQSQILSWNPGAFITAMNSASLAPTYLPMQPGANGDATLLASPRFVTDLRQFSANATTKILRVRPVFAGSGDITNPSVTIGSTAKFSGPSFTIKGPFTSADQHGWIATTDAYFGDCHRIDISFVCGPPIFKGILFPNTVGVTDILGVEVEYIEGPKYTK